MQAESGGANFEDHALSSPTLISFDESGFTGPNLLRDDQPVFAYAAVELSIEEANQLIAEIRDGRKPVIQAAELKASGLRKRKDWPEIAGLVLSRMEGRYSFLVADKRLAFAGKVFEYLMEPVLEDNSLLFYRHGLHRLVAGAVYRSIATAGACSPSSIFRFESAGTRRCSMGQTHSPLPRTIKKPELRQMVPLADSTIWEMEQRGEFPKRFRLTPRCVVWDLSEVQAWLEKRRRTPVTAAKAPDVRLRRTRPVHDGPGAARPHL